MKKILVIAAHPDDEILGIGGTLLKHKVSKDEIYICMATKAYTHEWSNEYMQQKIIEQKKIDKLLSTKKRFNLDFPTAKLNSIPYGNFNKKIIDIVKEVNPDIIYTHFEHDSHDDHHVIFRASLIATRPRKKKICLICYETLSETEWGNISFHPNYWVDISDHIKDKIKLFNIYKSEIKQFPNPRSSHGIEILAKKRGMDICTKYAEAFRIIRMYWL